VARARNPIVRLKPETYRFLQRRAKAEGKPIGRLIDEAVRPGRRVDPAAILERIQDLLDARELAAATADPRQAWVPLEQLDRELGLTPKPDRQKRRA
jgi:hypothetical protein